MIGSNGNRIRLTSSSPPSTYKDHHWSVVLFVIGMFGFVVDPITLYLPKDCGSTYICADVKSALTITFLRSLGDVTLLCAKYVTPIRQGSHRAGHDGLRIHRLWDFGKANLMVDFFATFPLPQIITWHTIHKSEIATSFHPSSSIGYVILLQICFRVHLMLPVSNNTMKVVGLGARSAWAGALLNLTYFMILSHICGALYYDMYISKLMDCKNIILKRKQVSTANLDWGQMVSNCTEHGKFEIGMFSDALTTRMETRDFVQKFVYCWSWGLKSLSSFGQIFNASSDFADTIFSFLTVIFGLILFGDLLARMQSGLQTTEVKENEQRTKQRMMEEWMKYHQLPQGLKRQVKQAIQSEWSSTKGIHDEAIMSSLPLDVRSEVRRHLYLEIVQTLPVFAGMDLVVINTLCGYLKTFSSKRGTYMMVEQEPVWQMVFIYSGQLEVSHANNSGQSTILGPGELCGRELLQWVSFPTKSADNLPPSTQTVKCITDVEAFYLTAPDVKLLAIQFHRDGKFRQAFKRYIV